MGISVSGVTRRPSARLVRLVVVAVVLTVIADPAFAYVGPGAGLSVIGSLVALIAAVAAGIFGFVWFPIKRLLRGRRKSSAGDAGATPPQ